MTDIDLHAAYERYLAAINARKLERMHEFAHDTITFNGEAVSRDAYVDAIRRHLAAVEGFSWHLEDIVVEVDLVATRLTDRGTPVSEWLGIQPTGAAFTTTEFCIYRYRDGRFYDMHYLLDAQTVAQQLATRSTSS